MRAGHPSDGEVLEIACDESGYEGDKLIGATTDVFAHASVRLDRDAAAECIRELRRRIRSPAQEYKANHLLRDKHRRVLEWLLGPAGPLAGNAHVQLVDKAYLVVAKLVELLVADRPADGPADDLAGVLYREGRRAFGRESWQAFLMAANDLLRAKDQPAVRTPVDSFFRLVDALRRAGAPGPVTGVLELLRQGRARADAFRARLRDNPAPIPALDPLIPAIVRAIVHWGAGAMPVAVVHDQQNTLSRERIARLPGLFRPPGRLVRLTLVDSRADSRVQVADFVAGVARKIASDELNERGDPELTALLPPYVDICSVWGDDRSWSRLGPAPVR